MSTQTKQDNMKMVRLDDDVHEDLTSIGAKNESYSKVVRRLIDFYRKNKDKK
jgi:predicted CopG family antitoxin